MEWRTAGDHGPEQPGELPALDGPGTSGISAASLPYQAVSRSAKTK